MTAPAPLLPPEKTLPTRWESMRTNALEHRDWGRQLRWFVPLVITLLAAVLRLFNLRVPHALAFDETYYVKDAWSLWTLGYEGTWADGANEMWLAGDASALSAEGSFVVHPPLGKWIIALGMGIFDTGSAASWRITTALLGTATVLVVYLITLRLSRSLTVAAIAALLIAIDGTSIVMSRLALLDGALTFFIVLGFLFLVLDHQRTIPILERTAPHDQEPRWGPVLWNRPWVIAAGVALGAASAVKWSGLYVLAIAGLYLVVTDALARRRAGVLLWPTAAAFRQGPVSFLLLVPAAALTYLVTWTGWLVTDGGYDRQSHSNPLIALWNYHQSMYGFHVGLSAGHPYASPAWQWPLLLRPTAVWVGEDDGSCATPEHCIAVISTVPNPIIWYAGVAAVIYLPYRFVRGLVLDRPMPAAFTIPLVGLLATYGPWLLYPERTIFQFYTVAIVPFLVIALALTLREVAGGPGSDRRRRQSGQRVVAIFLVACVLVSVFFYPVWIGMMVPYNFWLAHNWLPGWI